ncbi:MAG: polyhydroxyalkanoic acid system family protein [Planctomycetales bacterium]|nr:polyhydroxyalkanoic acid system family protein [Planctomycetales bacterium]
MPGFSTEVPHGLGQDGAKQRLESFLEKVQEKYKDQISEISGNWEGHTLNYVLTTFGIKIDGKLDVQEDKICMSGNLPFAAMMFKGKIESQIKAALEKTLA